MFFSHHLSHGLGYIFAAITFVLLVGASDAMAVSPGNEPDVRSYNLGHGRKVFREKCIKCHETGDEGAPILGELDDWSSRIQQPLARLIEHALNGHGKMPPKGDLDLTAQEVASAVAYVVYHGRLITSEHEGKPHTVDGKAPPSAWCLDDTDCIPSTSSDSLVVKMFWLLTNPNSSSSFK